MIRARPGTLSLMQAMEIVLRSLGDVSGVTKADSQDKLEARGIDTAAKLKELKAAIVRHADLLRYQIHLVDLLFDRGARIDSVCKLIVKAAVRKRPMMLKKARKSAPKKGPAPVKKAIRKPVAKRAAPMKAAPKKAAPKRGAFEFLKKRLGATKHVDIVYLPPDLFDEEESAPPRELPKKTVECTPQMEIREQVTPKKVYRMALFVDQGQAADGADVQRVKVTVPATTREFRLDAWLDCSTHFQVQFADPPYLTVNAETGVSKEASFTLTVEKAADPSPMYVSAFFNFNGRPSGKITRFFELRKGVLTPKNFVAAGKPEGEVVLPHVDGPPAVAVETQAEPADILVEVVRTAANDGRQFILRCTTGQGQWKGPWNLPKVSKDLVKEYMELFMSSEGAARIANLEGAGINFWKVVEEGARALILDAIENGARTMAVVSEEPYIPWELMIPFRDVRHTRQAIGVELLVGRWITGAHQLPPQHVPMKSGYIISPKDSGLASSADEVEFLTKKLLPDFAPADDVKPVTFVGVNAGLSGQPRHVIHFICHGKSALLQTLELDEGTTLNCSQVLVLKGFLAAFEGRPLAFLNACEVGGLVPALDGVGGFANSFIELGASAVVAPLWSVQDKAALEVTRTFYTKALKGALFAEVMKEIRAKAYSEAVDSYAAYCFYGDPLAHA